LTGNFSPRTTQLLDTADAACARRGARLTDLRREVLGLILDSVAPTGAYELLDKLRTRRGVAGPPTVYRALEFLREQGLVHRIERLSAFVGCIDAPDHVAHDHAGHSHGAHRHAAQFLICRSCRRVTEIEDRSLSHALAQAARQVGFTVASATIEAEGQCTACTAAATA
jgi:Fur family zinc uptake transcriptional regulator